MFSGLRHVFLDMDDTIYHGSTLFPTTPPFLDYLKRHGIGHTFLSNNSSYSTVEYVARLQGLGIAARPEEFYISTDYAIDWLSKQYPAPRRIFLLGMASIRSTFEAAGFAIDEARPEIVVIAFDRSLTYEKLCRAAWHLRCGVPGIATHPDCFCPTDQPTWLPDCGSITRCLETATGITVRVLGKPDPDMLRLAAEQHGLRPGQTLMVGDRLGTDIRMGRDAGAHTAWIIAPDSEWGDCSGIVPECRIQNLGELQQHMEKELGK